MNEKKEERQKLREIIFKRCISEYGNKSQIDMCIEEMSELTKALLKHRRALKGMSSDSKPNERQISELARLKNAIVDELADVRIMCRQMELIFLVESEVEERIDFKVKRQLRRLEKIDTNIARQKKEAADDERMEHKRDTFSL